MPILKKINTKWRVPVWYLGRLVLIVDLSQYKISWGRSLSERLSRSRWSWGIPVRVFLLGLIQGERPTLNAGSTISYVQLMLKKREQAELACMN